jgi:hypothetical protein
VNDIDVVHGMPVGVRVDGKLAVLWWGPDVHDETRDIVATEDARVLTWPSEAMCRSDAARAGWSTAADEEFSIVDTTPVAQWLGHVRAAVDPGAMLDTINTAMDVAGAVGIVWDPRIGGSARVYDMLVAASVPWVFGMESYAPRWSRHENGVLRAVVGRAMRVLRTEVRRAVAVRG